MYTLYRRAKGTPARVEEVHHAKEEGIVFKLLNNPTEVLADEKGWVRGLRCIKMELGEPDESGRRRPIEVPGSEFEIECDVVIMSLGTSPNPLIAGTTPGLQTERWGGIIANEETGETSREGIFAGGDAVTGRHGYSCHGAGRNAAKHIDEYVRGKYGAIAL